MRLIRFATLVCLFSLSLFACSIQRKFTYPLAPPIKRVSEGQPATVTVAVLPSRDSRQVSNQMAGVFLYLVPGWPYGTIKYNRPEAGAGFLTLNTYNADITEDLPKAIAQHLNESGLVKRAYFDFGGTSDRADYVLESEVREARYRGHMWSYGISAFCPYLWLLGAPIGTSTVYLDIQLALKNRDGGTVWATEIINQFKVTQGFYCNFGRDLDGLPISLQNGLEEALKKNPPRI